MNDFSLIQTHYQNCFHNTARTMQWQQGPMSSLVMDFKILLFAPTESRNFWTYATRGMSQQGDSVPIELHLFSPIETEAHVELLTVIAHYHLSGEYLNLGHTVNFGRPWLPKSRCTHGLISLPFLDGPKLEWLESGSRRIRFLWLLPITAGEVEFVKQHGVDALETEFEQQQFDYLDALRESVV